ncbi:hypothetical protein JXA32_17825 [Candidatus Sumerlaeota bacterium]|nr:hypothetical protein [Candidatus Sumerlaeota bacterium]
MSRDLRKTTFVLLLAILLSAPWAVAQKDAKKKGAAAKTAADTEQTTETEAVEGAAIVGLDDETAEDDIPTSLIYMLPNQPLLMEMIGPRPKFVYNDHGKEDPMLIPWVYAEYKAKELLAVADALWKERGKDPAKWELAIQKLEEVIAQYSETEVAQKNRETLAKWKELYAKTFPKNINQGVTTEGGGQTRRPFPPWVKQKFSSIYIGDDVSRICIDSQFYKPGDRVIGTGVRTAGGDDYSVTVVDIKSDEGMDYAVFRYLGDLYYYGMNGAPVPGLPNPE